MIRYSEDAEIVRYPLADAMGDPPPGAQAQRIPVRAAYADAGTSEDTLGRGATVYSTAQLYLPFDTDIRRTDRVAVRGREWLVDGDPQRWRSPGTGRRAGCVVNLRSVRG